MTSAGLEEWAFQLVLQQRPRKKLPHADRVRLYAYVRLDSRADSHPTFPHPLAIERAKAMMSPAQRVALELTK